jgi:hypothetical protein
MVVVSMEVWLWPIMAACKSHELPKFHAFVIFGIRPIPAVRLPSADVRSSTANRTPANAVGPAAVGHSRRLRGELAAVRKEMRGTHRLVAYTRDRLSDAAHYD